MFGSEEFGTKFGLLVWLIYVGPVVIVFLSILALRYGLQAYVRWFKKFFTKEKPDSEHSYYKKP